MFLCTRFSCRAIGAVDGGKEHEITRTQVCPFLLNMVKLRGFESVSKAEAKGNICAGTCLQLGNL